MPEMTVSGDRRCQQAKDLAQPVEVEIGAEIVMDHAGN
jgi:hypothetical protein